MQQRRITRIKGELEIDHDRGVIYFHVNDLNFVVEHGVNTVLRICRLPRPIPEIDQRMLDITHMVGVDWKGDL